MSNSSRQPARTTVRLAAAAIFAATAAPVVAQTIHNAHPRILLDTTTLSSLRQRAQANTLEWQSLKSYCDEVLPGEIYPVQGDPWGSPPNIGSNYQGIGYLTAVRNLGMCYQVLKSSNPGLANQYGDKAVKVLRVISDPALFSTFGGAGDGQPCHDSGYGIRNYGVAFGIGYDWVYDRLSGADKTRIIDAANSWISALETPNDAGGCDYAKRVFPSNYHAGYFHAKAVIAMGTYGDNDAAPTEWQSWLGDFRNEVRPYFNQYFAGGGWLEGFANYAPSSILHMSLPIRAVKTATGTDFVNPTDGSPAYRFPVEGALYPMHFSWPTRAYLDDRDTNRSNGNVDNPPGTNQTGMFVHLLGALDYYHAPQAPMMRQYLTEVDAATDGYSPADEWERFLFLDPNLAPKPVASLPRSYYASGIGAVAARSDWSTQASWMSFRAAPYIEDQDQAEEYMDQGSLSLVRGGTPLLVNASGWVVHEPGGTCAEERVYTELNGGLDGSEFSGNGRLFNVFYVRRMNGNTVAQQYGQWRNPPNLDNPAAGPQTRISAFEDAGNWVYTKASHLEDMYRPYAVNASNPLLVASWSREILYLRPNRFVVLDRTRKGQTGFDQFLAFAFPANPANVNVTSGQKRLTVNFNGQFAGAMTTVYPQNASVSTGPLFPPSYTPATDWGACTGNEPVKVWQTRVRPADQAQDQFWLTVFDQAGSASQVATTSPLAVTTGPVKGVVINGGSNTQVVIAGQGNQDAVLGSAFAYSMAAAYARHILLGVAPGSRWSVAANRSGNTLSVSVTPGGNLVASSAGVVDFVVDSDGVVRSGDTVFVSGFDD
ncbi:MAG TPA: hypothetical protein VFN09_12255 [Rhodanobacteraceae bacterium]|nr:hypothetical protein [Rhodanobacteraceae bacterium]